jgi:hypothetical protein
MHLRVFLALMAAAAVAVGFALPGRHDLNPEPKPVPQVQTLEINP